MTAEADRLHTDSATQRIDHLGLPLDAATNVDTVCGLLHQKDASQLRTFVNSNLYRRQ
jgi:hypothetical protein